MSIGSTAPACAYKMSSFNVSALLLILGLSAHPAGPKIPCGNPLNLSRLEVDMCVEMNFYSLNFQNAVLNGTAPNDVPPFGVQLVDCVSSFLLSYPISFFFSMFLCALLYPLVIYCIYLLHHPTTYTTTVQSKPQLKTFFQRCYGCKRGSRKYNRVMKAHNKSLVRVQGGLGNLFADLQISENRKVGKLFMALSSFVQGLQMASFLPPEYKWQQYRLCAMNLLIMCDMVGMAEEMLGLVLGKAAASFTMFQGGLQDHQEIDSAIAFVLKSMRNGTDLSEEFWASPGMLKIKKVILAFFTLYIHSDDESPISYVKQMLSNPKFTDVPVGKMGFYVACADLLLHVCESGYQFSKTGSWDTMFHGVSQYSDFYADVTWLRDKAPYILCPEGHDFSESEFLDRLSVTVEKGESIVKRARVLQAKELRYLERVLSDLRLMSADVLSRSFARADRPMPFSVLVYGPSAVGKSEVMHMIHQHYAQVMKLDARPELKYTRNANANFWDGFRTEQWCIQLDDVAALRPAGSVDPSVLEFLQIVNMIPFCPDQADLSQKGRTPLRAKLVVASTNVKLLNAHAYFTEPSAISRRFPYIITPKPLPRFMDASGRLKIPTSLDKEAFPEYWTFSVDYVSPSLEPRGPAVITRMGTDFSTRELLAYLTQEILDQEEIQRNIKIGRDAYVDLKYCDRCHMPQRMCDCDAAALSTARVEVQSSRIIFNRHTFFNDLKSWFKSWFFPVSTVAIVAWSGDWSYLPNPLDYMILYFSGVFAMTCYMPFYGRFRRYIRLRFIENHLRSTVGQVFYLWPEMKGPLAQYLYEWCYDDYNDNYFNFGAGGKLLWERMGHARQAVLKRKKIILGVVSVVG